MVVKFAIIRSLSLEINRMIEVICLVYLLVVFTQAEKIGKWVKNK